MILLNLPSQYPVFFWIIAMIFSLYQGFYAFLLQKQMYLNENKLNKSKTPPLREWPSWEAIIVFSIHDFIYNFVCSLVGFCSWYILCIFYSKIDNLANIQTGTGILLAFFVLIAITGISGILPFILATGKIFSSRN
jgi:hypothetical protein